MRKLAQMDRLAGRLVIASVSGGKDSTAMALALRSRGVEFRAVFMDTGWEHPATLEYIRGPLTDAIGPIEEIRGEHTMESLIRDKAAFPRHLSQFCTVELKVRPMQALIESILDEGRDIVNAVGIRAAESHRRSRMSSWEHSDGFDCDVWRPLFDWEEADVIEAHREAGLEPNPLYLAGASRVGCWPCIFASKDDLRVLADSDPDRVDLIRSIEHEIGEGASARAKAKGKSYDVTPTFFSRSIPGKAKGFVPIDDVIKWARTGRGGRQVELGLEDRRGCMRWGLCDG